MKCFILLLAMMSSDSFVKHLRTEDMMEDLIKLQVVVGSPRTIPSQLGSFFQDLQTLWTRFRAWITVERLCSWCRRLKIYSREGLTVANFAMLSDLMGILPEVMEEQRMIGHVDLSPGKKLPFNQNSELTCAQLVPDLVSRSAGFKFPGH